MRPLPSLTLNRVRPRWIVGRYVTIRLEENARLPAGCHSVPSGSSVRSSREPGAAHKEYESAALYLVNKFYKGPGFGQARNDPVIDIGSVRTAEDKLERAVRKDNLFEPHQHILDGPA